MDIQLPPALRAARANPRLATAGFHRLHHRCDDRRPPPTPAQTTPVPGALNLRSARFGNHPPDRLSVRASGGRAAEQSQALPRRSHLRAAYVLIMTPDRQLHLADGRESDPEGIRPRRADLGHLPVAMSWQSGGDLGDSVHVGSRSCQQLRCHQVFCPRGPAPARSSSAAGRSDLPLTQARATPLPSTKRAGGRRPAEGRRFLVAEKLHRPGPTAGPDRHCKGQATCAGSFWLLAAGCWLLAAGCWLLDPKDGLAGLEKSVGASGVVSGSCCQ